MAWQAVADSAYAHQSRQRKNLRDLVTPSGVNDTAAVNAALAAFDADGGGVLYIPKDDWVFTGSTGLELVDTVNPIHIVADPGTVFDMVGCSASIGLSLGGSLGNEEPLDNDAIKGADQIDCTLDVVVGDIVQILSTDVWTAEVAGTVEGEMAEVESTDGTTITLKNPLLGGYSAATTTVTKVNAPRVSVEGLTILRDGNVDGLQIQYARDVSVRDVYAEGARYALIRLSNVFGGTVQNCRGRDFYYAPNGTSYGLSVASSQHITEVGNDFRGGRHAVMHGGTFPCRDIQVIGGTFDNIHSTGIGCFDFHANCENVRVYGATMLNGVLTGASNADFDSCTIRTSGTDAMLAVNLSFYRDCDYVRMRNCDIQVGHDAAPGVVVTARSGTAGVVEVAGHVRAGSNVGGVGVLVQATDTATIERLIVGGEITARRAVSLPTGSDEVAITDTHISGLIEATVEHAIFVSNTSCGRIVVENADVLVLTAATASFYGIDADDADVTIRNTRLAAIGVTGNRNYFGTGRLAIIDSEIDGYTSGGVSAGSASEAFLSGVRVTNTSGVMVLPARRYSRVNSAGKVTTQGLAAPSSGTWARGDVCENEGPSSGGPPGWVCTTGGTPGTWKAMANLA